MIQIEKLTKTYTMGESVIHALDGLSIHIKSSEFVAIMGASGSGKSTLLNVLGCLDTPSQGQYRLRGHQVDQMTDDQLAEVRNKEIGFIFQTFNLLPGATAIQNVALPLIYARRPKHERLQRAKEMLTTVGLSDRARHKPMELSGGQRQRVAIARALINHPAIILADEPTGNLDSKTSRDIMGLFQKLHGLGHTLILVTHENDIAAYAQRVIHLKDGKIHEDLRKN